MGLRGRGSDRSALRFTNWDIKNPRFFNVGPGRYGDRLSGFAEFSYRVLWNCEWNSPSWQTSEFKPRKIYFPLVGSPFWSSTHLRDSIYTEVQTGRSLMVPNIDEPFPERYTPSTGRDKCLSSVLADIVYRRPSFYFQLDQSRKDLRHFTHLTPLATKQGNFSRWIPGKGASESERKPR